MRLAVILIAFLFSGCVFKNECGYSTKAYSDCVEGYDAQGIYYKKCPSNNIYDKCNNKKSKQITIEECLNCN